MSATFHAALESNYLIIDYAVRQWSVDQVNYFSNVVPKILEDYFLARESDVVIFNRGEFGIIVQFSSSEEAANSFPGLAGFIVNVVEGCRVRIVSTSEFSLLKCLLTGGDKSSTTTTQKNFRNFQASLNLLQKALR